MTGAEAARVAAAMSAAYREMCAAEDAAPGPRGRMAAAIGYLAALLDLAPDAALSDDPTDGPLRPGAVCPADAFRSEVLGLATALRLASGFQLCDHSRASWCAEPDCYAMHWTDPADLARVVPLDHRHCPACQGIQRGGQPWQL
jgi:hypothetical protein